MKKILVALIISVFTVGAFACDGNGKSGSQQSDSTTKSKSK